MVNWNLSDKLQVSNGEIHSTRECVNLVKHTNFTLVCYRSCFSINKFNARGSGYELHAGLSNLLIKHKVRAIMPFKVNDFSTNRKLIYDFMLVINTNLPPILHRFQVMVKFSLARGECLTLMLSLGAIPYQYCRKWYIAKN